MAQEESYKRKRDFNQTPEPESAGSKSTAEESAFVIQKHDASNLHYDFRLEIDGTLKSWAIPKGPSTDPSEKRLAIPTEDHPLEYANFEGVIPEGEYGAGTVMIWDKGNYENIKQTDEKLIPLEKCYTDGQIEISLKGEKITGGYALVNTGSDAMDNNWLLIKMDDDEADARRSPVSTENKSVKSDRTIKEIQKEEQDNG